MFPFQSPGWPSLPACTVAVFPLPARRGHGRLRLPRVAGVRSPPLPQVPLALPWKCTDWFHNRLTSSLAVDWRCVTLRSGNPQLLPREQADCALQLDKTHVWERLELEPHLHLPSHASSPLLYFPPFSRSRFQHLPEFLTKIIVCQF